MKAAEAKKRSPIGLLIALLLIAGGIAAAVLVMRRTDLYPASSEATIDAERVKLAMTVGGRVMDLAVQENQLVTKGQVLLRLDPEAYQLAVQQARADLAMAQAAVASQRRLVATETANAAIAAAQLTRAQSNYDLSVRTVARMRPLAAQSYVSAQQFDAAQTAMHDAAVSLAQAEEQSRAAEKAVGTLDVQEAAVAAREAALAIAERALRETVLRAPVQGRISGLNFTVGEVVAPMVPLFSLIATEEWFAVANMRETDLAAVKKGDCVTVYSLIDRSVPIAGTVIGIGWGIMGADSITLPGGSPMVARSMNWVRVAQRFPVRIALHHPPEDLMRVGASADVEIRYGAACH